MSYRFPLGVRKHAAGFYTCEEHNVELYRVQLCVRKYDAMPNRASLRQIKHDASPIGFLYVRENMMHSL